MRNTVLIVAAIVSLSLSSEQLASPLKQDLLDRADSLMGTGALDSAKAVAELALSAVLNEFGRSDSTFELHSYSGGTVHRYYFLSFPDAENALTRALALREAVNGSDGADLLLPLDLLAALYERRGRYAGAEQFYRRALEIRKDLYGPKNDDVLQNSRNLALVCFRQSKYVESETLFKEVLARRQIMHGPNSLEVAESLDDLACLCREQGTYAKAEQLFMQAIEIRKDHLEQEDPVVAESLRDFAVLYRKQGRYEKAEQLCRQALSIGEKVLGNDHEAVAQSLNDLAVIHHERGLYFKIEPLLDRALSIFERRLGSDHPDIAETLGCLAALYCSTGRYDEVEPLLDRAISIRKAAFGNHHLEVARTYEDLARLYCIQQRYGKAVPLLQETLKIRERSLGGKHPGVAQCLHSLGVVYLYDGKRDEARELFERARDIRQLAYGPAHPSVAQSLSSLAALHRDESRYGIAEQLFVQAQSIAENSLGKEHYYVAENLEAKSRMRRLQNNTAEAIGLAARAVAIRYKNFVDNAPVLSEQDALKYSHFLQRSIDGYLTCYSELKPEDPRTVRETVDIILRGKGRVSDIMHARRLFLSAEQDSSILGLLESLKRVRTELSRLFLFGPGADTRGYRTRVDSLTRRAKELDAGLSRRSAGYSAHKEDESIDAHRVASILPSNSVLVEYVRFNFERLTSDNTTPRYLVTVISPADDPVIVDLDTTAVIDGLVSRYRSHMLRVARAGTAPNIIDRHEYRELGSQLYDALWRPIREHVSGSDLVLIAPDGALNLVSFAALVDEEGSYLVETVPIHYLSSGRDIVRLEYGDGPAEGLFALGDPDYDGSAHAPPHGKTARGDQNMSHGDPSGYFAQSGRGGLLPVTATPLPGTRREIELVAAQWRETTREPFAVLLGIDASEDTVKSDAPGYRVIHLATHGFFLEETRRSWTPEALFESDIGAAAGNPLLLSGLLLSGANRGGVSPRGAEAEDGILTAYEVSAMDVDGADMVVLSACETGVGEVQRGEGVYGLRRSFQMAGARTVVSALWPVSDEMTARMMGRLYARSEQSLPERLSEMQREQLRELRDGSDNDHPFSWAGFIVLGDWRAF